MAYACELEPFSEDEPADLRTAADSELFDPGLLGSLTREQVKIIDLLVKNNEVEDIAKDRGTQPEQIDLVIENIRQQTRLPLSELADLLIRNSLIEPPVPAEPAEEMPMPQEPEPILETEAPPEEEAPVIEAEPEPEETAAAEPEPEELSPIARQQIHEYLVWMYPRENLDHIDELSDEQILAVAEAVRAAAKKYDDSLRKPRKRHVSPPAIKYMDLWLQGYGIPKIANLMDKNDGAIRLSLAPFAEKIGKTMPLDELLEQAAKTE